VVKGMVLAKPGRPTPISRYLGRFERWTSFDVRQHPTALLAGVIDALCPRAAL